MDTRATQQTSAEDKVRAVLDEEKQRANRLIENAEKYSFGDGDRAPGEELLKDVLHVETLLESYAVDDAEQCQMARDQLATKLSLHDPASGWWWTPANIGHDMLNKVHRILEKEIREKRSPWRGRWTYVRTALFELPYLAIVIAIYSVCNVSL